MPEKYISILPHKTNSLDQDLIARKTATFDLTSFKIETNLSPREIINRYGSKVVASYTLEDISALENFTNISEYLDPEIKLNLKKSDPTIYATYSSFLNRINTAINRIQQNYPAALRIRTQKTNSAATTTNVTNYTYNPFNDSATFNVLASYIINPLDLNYLVNNNNFNQDLLTNYTTYEVNYNGVSYPILELTGANHLNDKLQIKVLGNPFSTGNNSVEFYIKPQNSVYSEYFNSIDDLENYLLQEPFYFDDEISTENSNIIKYKLQFSWPRIDSFNLDVSTNLYDAFYTELTNYALKIDESFSNLLFNLYTPKTIYYTNGEEEIVSDHIGQLIEVYGANFDKILNRINNIKYFHTISYDGENNVPNAYLPSYLKVLGWNFSNENDSEFLRLLALNSTWLWKSKGTRDAINFLMQFNGIPEELIDFDEYVYRSKRPVDIDRFNFYLSLIDSSLSLSDFPVDSSGYPMLPENSDTFYFQMSGNTDGGSAYFDYLYNFMPTFSGSSISYFRNLSLYDNIFTQEFILSGTTLDYDIVRKENLSTEICYESTGQTTTDPYPETVLDECDCPLDVTDYALEICTTPIDVYGSGCLNLFLDVWFSCDFDEEYNPISTIYITPYNNVGTVTYYGTQPGTVLYSGETYSVYGVDANGCVSSTYSGTVICAQYICDSAEFNAELIYSCQTNGDGLAIGKAVITEINISGGTAPYTTNIAVDDEINHNETVTLIITDANGCSDSFDFLINCPPDEEFICENISLLFGYEVITVSGPQNTAIAKLNYDVYDLPDGVNVSQVKITVAEETTSFMVGGPIVVKYETQATGTEFYTFEFDPDPAQTVSTLFNFEITLSNGCKYVATYADWVEYNVIGYSFSQNFNIIAE